MEFHRPDYSLREAAGLLGYEQRLLRRRMDTLYGKDQWYYRDGRRIRIPAGILRRFTDRGGTTCPHCWRRYSTPEELVQKDVWTLPPTETK